MISIHYILFGVRLTHLKTDKGLHEGLVTNSNGRAYIHSVHQKLGSKQEQPLTKLLKSSIRMAGGARMHMV
jgi:hypothetical protein